MQPTRVDAFEIAGTVLGRQVASVRRFPTGLHHFVYEVLFDSGDPVVLRIADPENRPALRGALYWEGLLRPLGVPLPEVLHSDLEMQRFAFPFLVLERLPGTDLGDVYGSLSTHERQRIARQMVDLQRLASRLPEATGYGYALDSSGRGLAEKWRGVLDGSLRRTRRWIERAGVIDPVWADRAAARLDATEDLDDVRPRAFFHDITTKNVIVHEGRLTGIVDVDSMAFGDPLWTVALTRMALLSAGHDTGYIDAWCRAMEPGSAPADRLDLYTALHGVAFLGEIGQAFNREAPAAIDEEYRERLERTLSALL
ncbi:MAG: aminoglycoside phosphotransferase family protein [Deltaproteobacteria bacterium]|nr:aminoglycoside phosphotransferase family protein [Deltaproteobacteria bacterium]MBW2416205.1 aminoglycoside phosphotransferase family protein [Deltaproteobacteria bacterium]